MFRDKYKEHFNNINPKEELINKVKKEMFDIETSKKKKDMFINKKLVLSFAVLALVLGINYLTQLSKSGSLEDEAIYMESINGEISNNDISSLNDEARKENSKINTDSTLRREDDINFGEVEHFIGEASIALDTSNLRKEVLNYEEYLNYLGENPIPSYIPEGFTLYEDLENLKIDTFYNKDGEIVFDPLTLTYISKETLEDKSYKVIDISVSKINYLEGIMGSGIGYSGSLENSIINNKEVSLGYANLLGTKFHSQEEIEEFNKNDEYSLYIARFEKDGVYYIIKTRYLEKEEFLEVLKSLL